MLQTQYKSSVYDKSHTQHTTLYTTYCYWKIRIENAKNKHKFNIT